MTYWRRSTRYGYDSRSPSPYRRGRYASRSRSRSRSWSSSDAENPGNNLYVTGLPRRMTKDELERHFAKEGKVIDVHLVVDPWTRESRGFGFVTMATVNDAERCLKNLDASVLEGRVITVEKARRRRGRTPTPGQYLGLKTVHERHRSPSYSPYRRGCSGSPRYSSERESSYSPRYRRRRSRTLSRSPYYCYSRSHIRRRGCRSYSRDSRSNSPSYHWYRSPISSRRYRFVSRSISPRVRRSSRRSYSLSVSPRPRRSWKRSYSRSVSPRQRSHSRSVTPRPRRSLRSCRRSYSPGVRKSRRASPYMKPSRRSKAYSRESYSHSCSMRPYSRSVSRSP